MKLLFFVLFLSVMLYGQISTKDTVDGFYVKSVTGPVTKFDFSICDTIASEGFRSLSLHYAISDTIGKIVLEKKLGRVFPITFLGVDTYLKFPNYTDGGILLSVSHGDTIQYYRPFTSSVHYWDAVSIDPYPKTALQYFDKIQMTLRFYTFPGEAWLLIDNLVRWVETWFSESLDRFGDTSTFIPSKTFLTMNRTSPVDSVLVRNDGNSSLTISKIKVSEPYFTVSSRGPNDRNDTLNIKNGEGRYFWVTFDYKNAPQQIINANLIIYSYSMTSPDTIKLKGDGTTGVRDGPPVPLSSSLSQNYPNPFNPSTKIRFSITKSSFVILKVYDVLGREIKTLVDEEKSAGIYEATFNASTLPSGVYIYRLQAGTFIETKKMVLIK